MKPQEAELVTEISKVFHTFPLISQPGSVKETVRTKLLEIQVQKSLLLCLIDCILTLVVPSVTMHGVGAEDGLHQRSAGAQSDPTWRHVPAGGDGGEPEELPKESTSPGGPGGVTEGEGRITLTPENAQKFGYRMSFININSAEMMRCSFDESSHRRVVLQEELGVMQCQILQLYSNRQRPLQEGKSSSSKHRDRYST